MKINHIVLPANNWADWTTLAGERLVAGEVVIVDISLINPGTEGRPIDWLTGLSFAQDGYLSRISDNLFVFSGLPNIKITEGFGA